MGQLLDSGLEWAAADCDEYATAELAREAGISPIVARLLVIRGIVDAAEAVRFLSPSLTHLHDPSLLPDLDKGVERVARAISSGEKILVHGDYDVDGVTSTALLVRTLRALKADVEYRLPHRQRDGYDIKAGALDEMAGTGATTIVTCDCGVTAHEAVCEANRLGIDVVITDHHEPGAEIPPAVAVINPKREDALYPFPELAGVGVAFKFAQGLVRELGYSEESFQARFVDLVALGTVGDVVPLIGENRVLVKHGLEAIPESRKVGFQTMLRAANLVGKPLTAFYLAFVLGPRINSAGRMDDAATALRLFLTQDEEEAALLAQEIEHRNSQRKLEQERILAEAMALADAMDLSRTRVLVLSNEGWNTGVVGIVAGKLSEYYGRPAILVSRDAASGMAAGSARSRGDFNLVEALRCCDELLSRYGGHALAAGLSLPIANIEPFEEMINAVAAEVIPEEEVGPRLEFDLELLPANITRELADAVARMEPFGTGNPEPLFVTRSMVVVDRQRVGDGSHLKMRLQGQGVAPIGCIAFGLGDLADRLAVGQPVDVAYHLQVNKYNGVECLQMSIKAIRS